METLEFNTWKHPKTGATRYYLTSESVDTLLELEVHRYNTGNPSTVYFRGEKISNYRYNRINGKFWVDEDRGVHMDYFNSAIHDEDELRARFEKLVANSELPS